MLKTRVLLLIIVVSNLALLCGCVRMLRAREFVVEDKQEKKILLDGWVIQSPKMEAFRNMYGDVTEIPNFDSTAFCIRIIAKPTKDSSVGLRPDVKVDSVKVSLVETGEVKWARLSLDDMCYCGGMPKEGEPNFCTGLQDKVIIPMDIDTVLLSFDVIVTSTEDSTQTRLPVSFRMKRNEPRYVGFTYGD